MPARSKIVYARENITDQLQGKNLIVIEVNTDQSIRDAIWDAQEAGQTELVIMCQKETKLVKEIIKLCQSHQKNG